MLKDSKMQLTVNSNYLGKELGSFQLLCSVFVLTSMCPLEGELEQASTVGQHNFESEI